MSVDGTESSWDRRIRTSVPIISSVLLLCSLYTNLNSDPSKKRTELWSEIADVSPEFRLRLGQLLDQEPSDPISEPPSIPLISTSQLLNVCDDIALSRATGNAQELASKYEHYLTPDQGDELQEILDMRCEVAGMMSIGPNGEQAIIFRAQEPYDICNVEVILDEEWSAEAGYKNGLSDPAYLPAFFVDPLGDEEKALEACLDYHQQDSVLWLESLFPGRSDYFQDFSKAGCLPREVYASLERGRVQLRVVFSAPLEYEICNYLYIPIAEPENEHKDEF